MSGWDLLPSTEDEERYQAELSAKLLSGGELSELDRRYLADRIAPKAKAQPKKPAHRPKGSITTYGRNLHLCVEYLDLLEQFGAGGSDAAYKALAANYGIKESTIRKSVGTELLHHVKILHPFILREKK
ncbi:hypothetical protein [Geobacter argillaceus]|uniref:Uncharacterized protein n=1 Tax=Geobacter argillaceus TaxID=345631 RepID=A0A562WSD7_9BACT|nr:hypothetical protein [Geobacter argillaceus]TWJ33413.1 hypothetical protein JN12_00086 [Geobacter argillaceus]